MRHVGIREFKSQATTMLGAGETLVSERHGTPIGFFVPIEARDRQEGQEALGRLGRLLDTLTERTGIDEDELVPEVGSSCRRRG